MLITGAEVAGRSDCDVRIEGGCIVEIGHRLGRRRGEPVRPARGGALLPGLHDHHIHLGAAAEAARGVACGPPAVRDERQLATALREAARRAAAMEALAGDGARGATWLRGVGYHESVAGELRAARLSQWVPDRAVRIQHRSGACWMLNRRALEQLGGDPRDWPDGAERDAQGEPTGRFFRLDDWLRVQRESGRPHGRAGEAERPTLFALSRDLARRGVTGVTDTSAQHDDAAARWLARASDEGELLQRGVLMGSEALGPLHHPMLERGALKVVLDEPRLPGFDELVARIAHAHAEGRAVAVHCVTRVELTFALGAWREAGARAGDRIEHAGVAPPELVDWIARTPLAVVSQPHFIRERGDAYLRDVDPDDLPWLYRARAWLAAGVPLAAGSDAPYGAPDPWRAMLDATLRRTEAGRTLGPDERLGAEEALALFTSDARQPGGVARKIEVGAPADLVLLERPWREERERLSADAVCLTSIGGRVAFDRDEGGAAPPPASPDTA